MNVGIANYLELDSLLEAQRGVLLTSDLDAFWAGWSEQAIQARTASLLDAGVLRRVCRGVFVSRTFDPWVLASRMYPDAVISTVSVLSRQALIGTVAGEQVWCARLGRTREIRSGSIAVHAWSMDPSLMDFGIEYAGAVRVATPEKAFLDTLYYHLHGRTYPFSVPDDIDVSRLDREAIESFLRSYRNLRFRTFVRGVLDESL